jgi:hypothetical protein
MLSNGRSWPTRKAASAHFRDLLGRYGDGDTITDATDHEDLCALLELYDSTVLPGGVTKAGAGVKYFSRRRNFGEGWSTSGFHVHRVDGTSIDFSFYHAVGTPQSK